VQLEGQLMSKVDPNTLEGRLSELADTNDCLMIIFGHQNSRTLYPPYVIGKDFISGNDSDQPGNASQVVVSFNRIQEVVGNRRR
jgi:hypothetical protein